MEYIRSYCVTVEIDTNKRTYVETFHDLNSAIAAVANFEPRVNDYEADAYRGERDNDHLPPMR